VSPTTGNGELNYYKAAKEFMEESFAAVNNQLPPLHLEKTADWILKLNPQADSAMLIAAVTHDIERAFREDLVYQKMFSSENAFQDRAFLDMPNIETMIIESNEPNGPFGAKEIGFRITTGFVMGNQMVYLVAEWGRAV